MNQPGVRGGVTIIEGTRIGVHDVIALLQNGESIDSVCSSRFFPGITRAQVYECLAYHEDHRGIIVLIRRKSRMAERVALVNLLDRAGDAGIVGNINLA